MKTIVILLLSLATFLGCQKEEGTILSAKDEFNSASPACEISGLYRRDSLYFFSVNNHLYLQEGQTGPAHFLELLAGPKVDVSWSKGLRGIYCISSYGGSYLPGGNSMRVYVGRDLSVIDSPSTDFNFSDVRIVDNDVLVELFSVRSYMNNVDHFGRLAHPENVKKRYGRYDIVKKTLSIDL